MSADADRYIPALSFRWLTPVYDPILKWVMQEEPFKRRLLAEAGLHAGQRVLDLGCGTGTLTVMAKEQYPTANLTGLDGDPEVLAIARTKAAQAGLAITWDHGLATELPYPAQAFDRVLSSLMLHHLTGAQKRLAFAEVFRALRPGGEFHIVDFGPPHTFAMRAVARVMRSLEETPDHFDGWLPGWLAEAGFSPVTETGHAATILGPLSLYQAVKPC